MTDPASPPAADFRAIPLDRLAHAPENVRTVPPGAAADAELRASIAAHGLQQNLVVRPDAPGSDGGKRWAVVAGGRRLAALRALAGDGALPPDFPVPCRMAGDGAHAEELSLAENVIRISMHPADQIVAFAKLADAGSAVADIAARFGVSERLVEQRLRLAGVAPAVLDAYRAGGIDLETLKAFAVTDDRARQTAVWEQVGGGEVRPAAWQVRRLISEGRVPADAALARFVGLEAYEAAGGALDRDLFASDDGRGAWLADPNLLDALAMERLRGKAAELAGRWKWAEPVTEVDWSAMARYGRIHPEPSEPTADERAEMERLHARMRELMDLDEEDWTDPLAEEAHGIEVRIAEIEAAIDARAAYRPEDFAVAGAIVSVDREGELAVYDGLVRPEDMPERTGDGGGVGSGGNGNGNGDDGAGRLRAPAISPPAAAPARDPQADARREAGVSAGLADDLRAIRAALVKAHLERDFDAAFDLLLFQLARSVFGAARRDGALDMAVRETPDRPAARLNDPRFADWSPGEATLADTSRLPLDWMRADDDAGAFAALRDLPDGGKRELFAACVARTLKGQLAFEPGARPEFEATAQRLDIDFAAYVRPSADLLWSRISRARILEIAGGALGPEWARSRSGLKKAELAAAAEEAFAADGTPAWTPPGFAPFDAGPGAEAADAEIPEA